MEEEERIQQGGNPDWMSRLPEELRDVPLWNLAIPGKSREYCFIGGIILSNNVK